MIVERNHHNLVAPTSQLSRIWELHSTLPIDPFLSWAQDFCYKKILFYQVSLNSSLFSEINKKVKGQGLTPVYVITSSQFANSPRISQWIDEGLEFTLIFNGNVSPEVITKVQTLGPLAENLKFVLLGRKDWNVRDAYRSFPYFLRDRLYVDFPASLYPGDPFYSIDEIQEMQKKMEGDFNGDKLKSYCPELARYSHTSAWSVAEVSAAPLLESHRPKLTIVATSRADCDWIAQSKVVQERVSELELIVTRIAGASVQLLPKKLEALSPRQICLQPFQASGSVSRALLFNLAAHSAQGEFIIFANSNTFDLLEPIIDDLLDGRSDELSFLKDHHVNVFNTQRFKSSGGFDLLLATESAQWFDIVCRYFNLGKIDQNSQNFRRDFFSKNPTHDFEKTDRQTLYLKNIEFADLLGLSGDYSWEQAESSFLSREKKRNMYYRLQDLWMSYKILYKNSFRVVVEGNLRFVLFPVLLLGSVLKRYSWLFCPSTYPFYWKMRAQILSFRAHLLRHYNSFYGQLWRLQPRSYSVYWHLRDHFKRNFWRLSPRNLGWFIFKIAYPLRKVYYFTSYQYEKRVLGLHKKRETREGL